MVFFYNNAQLSHKLDFELIVADLGFVALLGGFATSRDRKGH
jgi:hypothetical protein